MKLKISIYPSVRANLLCSFQCETPCMHEKSNIYVFWIFKIILLKCVRLLGNSNFQVFSSKIEKHSCHLCHNFWSNILFQIQRLTYQGKELEESAMCVIDVRAKASLPTYLTITSTLLIFIFPLIFLPILFRK